MPATFTTRELALDRAVMPVRTRRDGEVENAVDGHDPVELAFELLDDVRRATRDDGDAREVLGMLRLGDGQALDVVAPARE